MYRHNSTIRITEKVCNVCGKKRPIFSNGACKECAHVRDALANRAEDEEKEIEREGLGDIVKRLDDIYSKWLRLSYADAEGKCECYTCGTRYFWTALQCGHFIRRGNYLLRWDIRNTRPQCEHCNVYREEREMLSVFAANLEREYPGRVEQLHEERNIVFKLSRTDLNQMIVDYTIKFKKLKR